MASLGDLRTTIADELQIDATTMQADIDRAIYTAIKRYQLKDYWFLEAAPTAILLTATAAYSLVSLLPERGQIQSIVLELSPGKDPLRYVTHEEMLALDFDENFTGEPCYWNIWADTLHIAPKPSATFTAVVWYSLRNSMTATASAESVWTNEAEELIRTVAKIDLLRNRIKDYTGASILLPMVPELEDILDEQTAAMISARKIKPWGVTN